MSGASPTGEFPRSQRVRKRSEFQVIQAAARRVSTPHLALLIHAPAQTPHDVARLGLVVSRRVGNSPARSRAKRLVREAFRATRQLWHPEIDVVIVVKIAPPTWRLADVVHELCAASRSIARRSVEAVRARTPSSTEPT